jgi:hypothetical protein
MYSMLMFDFLERFTRNSPFKSPLILLPVFLPDMWFQYIEMKKQLLCSNSDDKHICVVV